MHSVDKSQSSGECYNYHLYSVHVLIGYYLITGSLHLISMCAYLTDFMVFMSKNVSTNSCHYLRRVNVSYQGEIYTCRPIVDTAAVHTSC